ncbi:hypothetical protein BD324DRAFT_620219 [Kockovaella imperatae]|uniref:[histone H3]-dimethyl-L-lysine(36) demethylase n=1 Tax=Kockovaella imperatae TaxID=4999 RepID=A0A1Y1UJP6_9TREE|nr:hypothetical protein BD324DRAFT_620219 [Kockovaella imperatae]ORX38273.1 hypothetical protein BD324DRAFT_620219 [Kockovaella imperatae]
MTDMEEDSTELKCPLCPESGPPTGLKKNDHDDGDGNVEVTVKDEDEASSSTAQQQQQHDQTSDTRESPDLYWIECSRCKEWYHSVCLLTNKEQGKRSVPAEIIAEAEAEGAEGVWSDWTGWVDRWYCPSCISWSVDPTNDKRPHHPLVATLNKRTFPPKKSTHRVEKRSSERTASPGTTSKKPRLSSTISDTSAINQKDPSAPGDVKAKARPKRQAALNRPDYHALHHHIATPTAKWLELIANPQHFDVVISEGNFPRVPAEILTKSWIDSSTLPSQGESSSQSYPNRLPPSLFFGPDREPLIIKPEDGGFEGLGGKIPGKNFTVADVGRLVGMDRMVDVIDVASQQSSQWPLAKWVEYVQSRKNRHSDPGPSSKTYNIISLEISGTDLAKKVKPPRLVSEIDWVDNFWNFGPAGKNAAKEASEQARQEAEDGVATAAKSEAKGKAPATWPKVQLYCLMGAKGSWTDWHVDFAASSVYYTVHTGAKTFFFIRPTPKNLAAYAEWSGSYELQQNTWLGSMCDEVRKVTLHAGDTMIIPSGYIHAVHTPADSIVFGGNFLHSFNIQAQLRLRQIEIDTKVPQRFRFPFFDRLCWYVAEKYCAELRSLHAYRPRATAHAPTPPSTVVLDGLYALAQFLVDQASILEDPRAEDKRRKLIHDRIPAEIVHDPSGLARELLWRVQRELPHLDVPDTHPRSAGAKGMPNGTKKGKGLVMLPSKPKSRVWNFTPPPWEQNNHPVKESTNVLYAPRPSASSPAPGIARSSRNEKAEATVHVYSQNRSRVRDLDDGSTVLEEQRVEFTERRVIWLPQQGFKLAEHEDVPLGSHQSTHTNGLENAKPDMTGTDAANGSALVTESNTTVQDDGGLPIH